MENPDARGALRSYVLGDKRKLKRGLRWAHQALSLQHLFTPSGLHLSSIFLFIRPILFIIRKFSTKGYWIFSLLLFLLPFLLPGFWAIKRICLLKISKLIFPKLSWFKIFLITFLIDFNFGTFKYSPLSFCFSFLFLGLIFSLEGRPKIYLPLVLFTGQVLVAFFWSSLVNPMSLFLGQFLSFIFSFLFPIFFVGFWFPLKIFLFPLDLFLDSVLFSAKLAKNFFNFYVTLDILILFLFICSNLRLKTKVLILTFFIGVYPPNIFNLEPKYFKRKKRSDFYLVEEKRNIERIKRTRRGYKITYKNGFTCWYYLFNTYWQKSCY